MNDKNFTTFLGTIGDMKIYLSEGVPTNEPIFSYDNSYGHMVAFRLKKDIVEYLLDKKIAIPDWLQDEFMEWQKINNPK
jgi:hypothetical protein